MVSIKTKGDFKNFDKFVKHMTHRDYRNIIERYARKGVVALSKWTPIDSGMTASSWGYEIHYSNGKTKIVWTNSNTTKYGAPIALLIQYGHATKNGYWVEGVDFINPALRTLFIEFALDIWNEVKSY